ncbi:NAD(P)/FAD-dependent oxidoreductase [Nocardioides sp. MAH-18]|uniref:NAD(P)/FAD-dependent oxidoreductase n=1 Tax=Nocardioides agri TaxID=2682843 RepID=A0A6L6XN81_9ACTN|nr:MULTISPECIES: FAD-dependent monooxygenase [unclassified Nocardioides]MBA2953339.1 FAD-dependent monooxygenase [Nocardioides sp. CGMCC 1.13656]MVQ48207.1 NAD(P)/FAD-dependent oxidoreductase [Nocardioides sp. MAH-18]
MNGHDVVVVGARVGGASTAMLLARAGLRVALVDRGSYGSDTLSTHGLMRAGVLQLSRWGVLPGVVSAGTPPVRRTTFHYASQEPVQVSIRPSAGVEALYAPRRLVLDRLLVDAAARAGVDVLFGTTVTGLLRSGDGAVGGVVVSGPSGAAVTLPAAVTVGADGVRSIVAREAAAPLTRQGRHRGAILYQYRRDLPVTGYEWAYGDHAAAGLIPTNDGETCVFVETSPARMRQLRRAGADAAFSAVLAAAGPDLHDRVLSSETSSRLHGWAGLPGYLRRPWGPGWALVGDAGYYRDPITSHGITDALRDAELLARGLTSVLRDGTAYDEAMAGYETTRDRLAGAMLAATDDVAAFDWDVARAQGLLRRVSSAMSDEVDHLAALDDEPVDGGTPARRASSVRC